MKAKYGHEVEAEDSKVRIIWKVKYRAEVAKKLTLFLDDFEICCKIFWTIFSYTRIYIKLTIGLSFRNICKTRLLLLLRRISIYTIQRDSINLSLVNYLYKYIILNWYAKYITGDNNIIRFSIYPSNLLRK